MGNSKSSHILATAAVAKSMKLTKRQVLEVHRHCLQATKLGKYTVKRKTFAWALRKAKVEPYPDQDILHHLFTVWDLTGADRVPGSDFVVGFSSLACKDEPIAAVLRFAMSICDQANTQNGDNLNKGKITAHETLRLLRSLTATASYFGDAALGLRQIYKIVDNVFDTITMISHDSETMTHGECINALLQEPYVQQLLRQQGPSLVRLPPVALGPPGESKALETAIDKSGVYIKTRMERHHEFSDTEVSSVMLSPLAQGPPRHPGESAPRFPQQRLET